MILFIIPAKNESATIASVINMCKKLGDVLVVDDNSEDDTCNVAKFSGAKVIQNSIGGYSGGIYVGIEYARSNNFLSCITVDADGEHPEQSINAVHSKLMEGYEIVVGKRPTVRRLGESIYNKLYRLKFRKNLDYCCGLKGYQLLKFKTKKVPYEDKCGTQHFFQFLKSGIIKTTSCNIQIHDRQSKSRFGGTLIGNYKILKTLI
jgi:glycosyltransferase involved in cell wall biosynthesis